MIYEYDRYDFDDVDTLVEEFRRNKKFDNTYPDWLKTTPGRGGVSIN